MKTCVHARREQSPTSLLSRPTEATRFQGLLARSHLVAVAVILTTLVPTPVAAQPAAPQPLPPELAAIIGTVAEMAGMKSLSPEIVANIKSWIEPTEPFRIVGSIYYVGTRGLGVYLITTPEGHILLDGGMPNSAKDIEASIRTLGFKPADIRLLLSTQAHVDHVGTTAHFKKLSGATVAVMDRDCECFKSGGKSDPVYGMKPPFYFPPVTVDRVLKDNESVSLGNLTMTARRTAGHTPGCTTWQTAVQHGGMTYYVVFPGSISVNLGYRLVVKPSYSGIAKDYLRTFAVLESLKPDIWLAAHTQVFGFEEKRAAATKKGERAWVDPEGYRRYIASGKAAFDARIASEK